MEAELQKYFRLDRLPHIWCPGCGNGIVLGALVRAFHNLGLTPENTVVVSGIGCSSRAAGYLNFDSLHTTHGRALPFATGVKLARPELNVVVLTGDGDVAAIGGNHLIHAARRNLDLTVIVFNNSIYGMTGGQASPLTPPGKFATTAPYGTFERSFDLPALAQAAGATYTARATTYHASLLVKLIEKAIKHRGFALVEAITGCPVAYGRRNRPGDPVALLKWQKEAAVPVEKARQMSAEELAGKIIIGELYSVQAPEFSALLAGVQEKARSKMVRAARPMTVEETQFWTPPRPLSEPVGIRFGGAGGQGVVLAGLLLADAAVRSGLYGVHSQVYGPEMRGGASRSDVIIAPHEVDFPRVEQPDFLVIYNQAAAEKYLPSVRSGGTVLVDRGAVESWANGREDLRVFELPMSEKAGEQLGNARLLNVVSLGVLARLTAAVNLEALKAAVSERVDERWVELNHRALELGWEIAAQVTP